MDEDNIERRRRLGTSRCIAFLQLLQLEAERSSMFSRLRRLHPGKPDNGGICRPPQARRGDIRKKDQYVMPRKETIMYPQNRIT